MKVLITGHKGYIGSKLFNKLNSGTNIIRGIDLKDGENVINCLPNEEYDYVFHLAALPSVEYSVENPSYTFRQNAYATSILLEWAKNHKVKRVIFSSSAAAAGNGDGPTSPYGLHKLICEQECKLYSDLYKLDTVSLRYYNVFSADQEYGGSYSTVISAWIEMIKRGLPLRIDGDGEQSRDFINVADIVDANIFCMNYNQKFNGESFDVGTGITISLNEIRDIINVINNKAEFINTPPREGDILTSKADIAKLKNIGWTAKIEPTQSIYDCFNKQGE